jgi:hypothetical protein
MSDLADGLEFAAKVLRNASLKQHLKRAAFALVDAEKATGGFGSKNRYAARKKIIREFQDIYADALFQDTIQYMYNNIDGEVLSPGLEKVGLSQYSQELYAVPKYILADIFKKNFKMKLESSPGLEELFNRKFRGDDNLKELKKREFIAFIVPHETENWPAPGSEDTELGVLMEPEVRHGEAEVYTRVQA